MLDLTGYKLTFADEFNTRSISQTGKGTTWADIRPAWQYGTHADLGFGYASFVDPASGYDPFNVAGGALSITAVPDRTPAGVTGHWESGLITTQGGFSQTYGYFEMRAQLSGQLGAWDAFWLLPDTPANTLPGHQELDIVEHYGENEGGVYSALHTTDNTPAQQLQYYSSHPGLTTGYHTYGVDWQADTIRFYFDGQYMGSRATPSDMHGPMYILANLSTQNTAGNNPDVAGVPITMSIDYIRAFSAAADAVAITQDAVSAPDNRDPGLYGATSRAAVGTHNPGSTGVGEAGILQAFDFNDDHRSDILWRQNDGSFAEWQSTGAGFTRNTYVDGSVGTDWHLAATGDFNGNGKADLIWRHDGGTFTEWQSNGAGFTPNSYVDGSVGTDWHLAAAGDFNGDGKTDLIWRHDEGTFTEWQSNGAGFTPNTYVDGSVGPDWHLAVTGDFNGDGKTDLIWRHDEGTFTEWQSNGAGFTRNTYVDGSVGPDWHLAATGDFNGDGKTDLIWRHDEGTFTEWQSNGAGFTRNTYVDGSVGTDWQIAQVGDFNGDGKSDLLWFNEKAHVLSTWSSTGNGFTRDAIVETVSQDATFQIFHYDVI